MSTDTPAGDGDADPDSVVNATDAAESPPTREELAARVAELEAELETVRERAADAAAAADSQKMVIIATQGTLDAAYPPLILASTAAAFGYDVTVFHTFWGLEVLHEDHADDLPLSPVGNPNLGVPDALGVLPGVDAVTARMMRRKIDAEGVAGVEELIETSLDTGVDLQACQMTMDLFDYDEDDFFEGVTTGVGAATAFQEMTDADVQLLV